MDPLDPDPSRVSAQGLPAPVPEAKQVRTLTGSPAHQQHRLQCLGPVGEGAAPRRGESEQMLAVRAAWSCGPTDHLIEGCGRLPPPGC